MTSQFQFRTRPLPSKFKFDSNLVEINQIGWWYPNVIFERNFHLFASSHQLSPRNYGSLSKPSLHSTVVEAEGQSNYAGLKSSLSGLQLVWNQFLGLIIKRFIYTKRRFLLFGILGFVPMILAILVMLLANGKTNTRVFEPR